MAAWRQLSDSTSFVRYDSSKYITHEFTITPERHTVEYFHADE